MCTLGRDEAFQCPTLGKAVGVFLGGYGEGGEPPADSGRYVMMDDIRCLDRWRGMHDGEMLLP